MWIFGKDKRVQHGSAIGTHGPGKDRKDMTEGWIELYVWAAETIDQADTSSRATILDAVSRHFYYSRLHLDWY